jgi:dihydroorotase-like cyclic amidohydrolase
VTSDLLVRGGTAVLPGAGEVRADIAIANGRIAALGPDLPVGDAEVLEADGRVVVPGAIDAHYHLGIYRGFEEDTESETLSSLIGGVTSVLSYFRTGSHYLNRSGSYEEVFPLVLDAVAGRSRTDYAFHLAPMDRGHVREIPALVAEHGLRSFKYYMFYKGLDLAGDGDASVERMSAIYDLGHLFEIMEAVAAVQSDEPDKRISLSIHAEQPELIRLFMERVQEDGSLAGLHAYSESRPPLTERLAIGEAGVLAVATRCPINLLHLSSGDALAAATELRDANPRLDVRLETTLHHLALSYETYSDQRGKVNPPIRSEQDRELMWEGVLRGDINWVCSDHACCSETHKEGPLWSALPGFGGSALMYPYMLTEGRERGVSLERVVELVATNPARACGASQKGAIVVGADADLAIVDLDDRRTVTPPTLRSAQEYTPFEGIELTGWPQTTLLRGQVVMRDGEPVGEPRGAYLRQAAATARA